MKRNCLPIVPLVLSIVLLLSACGQTAQSSAVRPGMTQGDILNTQEYCAIQLSDSGVTVDGAPVEEQGSVYLSHDIVYYEDRTSYDSGHAYGEGEAWERHSAEEAAAHTVVNITAPGIYRLSGTLSRGQIRVDLGETAFDDPSAVVYLVLADAHITCTVAPAILFLNVYECDNQWKENTPTWDVDTSDAGANLVVLMNTKNTVSGSHVARIYQDGGEEKKLWKQDGAVYSYMSMNVFGSGQLDVTADNEGVDTELHLTLREAALNIYADNDGINTNEDGVSVTTIESGNLRIFAGLGAEGDGIDSNGWLVINGGKVFASAHPAADAGLDSDLGSYINGGTVLALGSAMDWAESDSKQMTMNLQFREYQNEKGLLKVLDEAGETVMQYDPADLVEPYGQTARSWRGVILSCDGLEQGKTYQVSVDGILQAYTGTDVQMRPGGFGGMGGDFGGGRGQRPENGQPMTPPEGFENMTPPEGFENMTPPEGFAPGQPPEGFNPEQLPEGFKPEGLPEGFENMSPPQGVVPGQPPEGVVFGQPVEEGQPNTLFFMQDMVNFFSGVSNMQK